MKRNKVHMAQRDSAFSLCGMPHVYQTPLYGDITCSRCIQLANERIAASYKRAAALSPITDGSNQPYDKEDN